MVEAREGGRGGSVRKLPVGSGRFCATYILIVAVWGLSSVRWWLPGLHDLSGLGPLSENGLA